MLCGSHAGMPNHVFSCACKQTARVAGRSGEERTKQVFLFLTVVGQLPVIQRPEG